MMLIRSTGIVFSSLVIYLHDRALTAKFESGVSERKFHLLI